MSLMEQARSLLMSALEHDQQGRKLEALKLYEDGIARLLEASRAENGDTRTRLQDRIQEYLKRAEELKKEISKGSSQFKPIPIEENSTGHSYDTIFGPYMDSDVTLIYIQDTYLSEYHQLCNLVRFCELAVKKCRFLRNIKVKTKKTPEPAKFADQQTAVNQLKENLSRRNIEFQFEYDENIHDRQIFFNNHSVFRLGRGLDYFKPTGKFSLGAYDYDYRECKKCEIIYSGPIVKKK